MKATQIVEQPACPSCFTQPQWDSWLAASLVEDADPGPSSYCRDCTPGYKARMKLAGLCAHPGTTFVLEVLDGDDGDWIGTRPGAEIRYGRPAVSVEHVYKSWPRRSMADTDESIAAKRAAYASSIKSADQKKCATLENLSGRKV